MRGHGRTFAGRWRCWGGRKRTQAGKGPRVLFLPGSFFLPDKPKPAEVGDHAAAVVRERIRRGKVDDPRLAQQQLAVDQERVIVDQFDDVRVRIAPQP